jgi:signal peptidase I
MEDSTHSGTFVVYGDLLPAEPEALGTKRNLPAAFLSTVLPGSGQIYLGDRRKGIALLVLLAAAVMGFWPLRLLRTYPGFCVLYCCWIAIFLYAPLSALVARGEPATKPTSKLWLILFVPLGLVVAQLFGIAFTRASGFRTFEVPSTSMERTIQKGDRIVADSWYYRARAPERDDVIIFKRNGTFFVKRVIAAGGDTVEGSDGFLRLNGQRLDESFVEHQSSPIDARSNTFGPVTVPRDKFFVMGDNRDMSLDSRYPEFGLVDRGSIVGKTLYVFASGRLGKQIQ